MARTTKPAAAPRAARASKGAAAPSSSPAHHVANARDLLPDYGAVTHAIMRPHAASFQEATVGGEERLAWARMRTPYGGLGVGAGGATLYPLQTGGRTARDAALAGETALGMMTSNPVISTLVLNATTQALGPSGLTLSAKPNAKALKLTREQARALSNEIETKWSAFAENPLEADFTGRHDLHQLAGCFFRSAILSGEALCTLEYKAFAGCEWRTKVQILDVSQLDRTITRYEGGLHIQAGVAFDGNGRLKGYMIRSAPLGAYFAAPAASYVAARTSWGRVRVLHTMAEFLEPRMTRGLSPLTASLTPALERETLGEFVLGKALLDNQFAISIESELTPERTNEGLTPSDAASNIEQWREFRKDFYSHAKVMPQVGTINVLAPNDKMRFHAAETPNSTFHPFDDSLVRKAAKSFGQSVEDVTGDYSKTSFSASRMATALPHMITEKRRREICEKFYKTVYECWLEEAIENGKIELPEDCPSFYENRAAWCSCKFLGRGVVQPDLKKWADAQLDLLENGLVSFTEILGSQGKDFEAHVETLIEERALLAEYGLERVFYPGKTQTRVENTAVSQSTLAPEDDEPDPGGPDPKEPDDDAPSRRHGRRAAQPHNGPLKLSAIRLSRFTAADDDAALDDDDDDADLIALGVTASYAARVAADARALA